MYNYWSYSRFLLSKITKLVKREKDSRPWFASKFNYPTQGKIKLVEVKIGSGCYVTDLVIAYRLCWKDGSISKWMLPKEDKVKFDLLGVTHGGEALIKN